MRAALLYALVLAASPVLADHPEERLDVVMAEKEPAFEAIDRGLPTSHIKASNGAKVDLRDLSDKIIVLSFVPGGCGAPCVDQQELLAEVQADVNITPMREMVEFVTVASSETPAAEDWDAANWLDIRAGEASAAELTATWDERSARGRDAPMVHVIDRGSRYAGIFHGAEFGRVNMVLYINGLTNAPPPEPSVLDRVLGVFR